MTVRLGELLIGVGLLTRDQCEQGLRAQVMAGGRLGTNLVELGLLDLDTLTRALGTQHGRPAALGRHFGDGDAELQQRLSAETARRLECLPMRHVFGQRHGVVIASTAPLDDEQIAEIADELLVGPEQLIPAIAPEMRIKFQLEQVYRIARSPRFLRVKSSIPPFAVERRGCLDARADALAPRRLARGSREMAPVDLAAAGEQSDAAFASALDAIRIADDRERVAALVLDAIERFVPTCDAAAILLVRGEVAIGWKSFSRLGLSIGELVVPLGYPGIVAAASRGKQTRGTEEMAPIDQMLLQLLGKDDGDLVVSPIASAGQVLSLLACAITSASTVARVQACAEAAGAAFARLMRDVSAIVVVDSASAR